MAGNIHPGSVVGDSIEEFKRLPTWGKVVAGILFLVVAYIGYSQYKSGQSASSTGTSAADDTTGTSGSQNAGIQTVPGGNTGQVPIFSSPEQPIYNPTSGTLEGFQPVPPTQPTSPTTTGTGKLQGNPPIGGPVVTPPVGKNPPTKVPSPTMRFVTVTKFPSQYGTLSGIAQANNVPLSTVEKLNPQIKNPNLIYAGQKVRIA